MPNFTGFFSFVMLAVFTPGPNNIMALANASKHGFKKAVPFNVGVFLGFSVILGLAAAASAGLYRYIPGIAPYLKLVGCTYILYLAWKTYKSTGGGSAQASRLGVLTGLSLQFINMKGVLFSMAVMSTFITPYYHAPLVLASFAMGIGAVAFVSTCSWSLFGAAFQKVLSEHEKLIGIIMSLLLVYCGISLFL